MLGRCIGRWARASVVQQRIERAAIAAAMQGNSTPTGFEEHLIPETNRRATPNADVRPSTVTSNRGDIEDNENTFSPSAPGSGNCDDLDDDDHLGGPAVKLVSSLQDFFAELRRLRRDIGKSSSRDRGLARDELIQFWQGNIGFALASCVNARDVGFVSFYGITDSKMVVPASLIPPAVQLLVRDKDVCNALDTTVSLRYLAREISRVLTSPKSTAEDKAHLSDDFVELFVQHGVERLKHLFISDRRGCVGEPEDAVHGLEFLLSLCNGHRDASMLTEVLLFHAARGDLLMTSVISCFGILRVSMPKLSRETTSELCVELLRAVKRKDDKLKNPFHFLKILMTMVRVDPKYMTHPNLWAYIVAKACIFVPNASPSHQHLMVMSIRKMLNDRGLDAMLNDLALEIQATIPGQYEALIVRPIQSLKPDK